MTSRRWLRRSLVTVGAGWLSSSALAQPAAVSAACTSSVTRSNVVLCALAASPAVHAERAGVQAAEGRQQAARPFLPSNPVVAFSAARRIAPAGSGESNVTNWYASLGQEVELGGQRSARGSLAEAELAAQRSRVAQTARNVAATAWERYFEALASREEAALAQRLAVVAENLAQVARAKADRGVLAPVDADVAEAASVHLRRARFAAERRVTTATLALGTLWGRDPSAARKLPITGDLTPLPSAEKVAERLGSERDVTRPEVQAARAEQRARDAQATLFRRARVPNITASIFAQNDGFNERVLGLGLSVPLPLPQPVGRTYAGQIKEAEALTQRAESDVQRVHRQVQLETATALAMYESRREEAALVPPKHVQRAEESVRALAEELAAGRLSVRDALLTQQALLELIGAQLEARLAWCLASVELARAAGWPLENGTP